MVDKFKESKTGHFLMDFFERFSKNRVPQTGAQLAYFLIMSFFPFLIFLLNALSFTPLAQEAVLNDLFSALPKSSADLLEPIILGVVNNRSGALLSISLVLALWSGSNGINNLLGAMDRSFEVDNQRNAFKRRLIAVFYTLMLAVIIGLTMFIQVFGDQILLYLQQNLINIPLLNKFWALIKLLLPLIIMAFSFSLLYRFGPAFKKKEAIKYKDALIGGTVTAVLWTGISILFSFYVNNFGKYANTYGSLGGVIILLLWLFISSVVIVIGAEFIATMISQRREKEEVLIEKEPELPVQKTPIKRVHVNQPVPKNNGKSKAIFLGVGTVIGTVFGMLIPKFFKKK